MKKIFLLSLFLFNFTHADIPPEVLLGTTGFATTSVGLVTAAIVLKSGLLSEGVASILAVGASGVIGSVAAIVMVSESEPRPRRIRMVTALVLGLITPMPCFMYYMGIQPF